MAKLNLAAALALACDPEGFLAFFYAVKTGAFEPFTPGAWLRRDGGKIYARRTGCVVHLTTAGY